MIDKMRRKPKCWICEDRGLVIYKRVINGFSYEIGARCSCEKGVDISREIPIVESNLAEKLAVNNYSKYDRERVV